MINLGDITNRIREKYNIQILIESTHPSCFISTGFYTIPKQSITLKISSIDYRKNKYFLVCILLHELGHHIDYLKHNCDSILFHKRDKYELEQQAWMYAKDVSKELDIEINEEFNAVMNYALSSYNNTSCHDSWKGWALIKKLYSK